MRIIDFKLETLTEPYLNLVLQWRNSEKIRSMMLQDSIISIEEHIEWYDSLKNSERTIVKLLVYNNNPIGLINFNKINKLHRTCYWGFYIGEDAAPMGSGTVLGYLGLSFVYEKLDMRKVCAEVIDINEKSINFHSKLCFKKEGLLKEHVRRKDIYLDVFQMAHFKKSWKNNKEYLEELIRRY